MVPTTKAETQEVEVSKLRGEKAVPHWTDQDVGHFSLEHGATRILSPDDGVAQGALQVAESSFAQRCAIHESACNIERIQLYHIFILTMPPITQDGLHRT